MGVRVQKSDRHLRGEKAVVAIARQLAVDLWRVFTGQTTAEKFGLIYQVEAA